MPIRATTGNQPTARSRGFAVFCAITASKASTGPLRILRPNAYSPISPKAEKPNKKMRYGIRNVMPPNSAKRAGNIQIFAKPIAEPTQARSIPMFVLKSSRFCFIFTSSKMLHDYYYLQNGRENNSFYHFLQETVSGLNSL